MKKDQDNDHDHDGHEDIQEDHEDSAVNSSPLDDRVTVLAIAMHNMGVELEFLKRFDEAIQTYKKAVKFSLTFLGESHSLVENLRSVLATAEAQIHQQKEKDSHRRLVKGKY